MLVLLTIGTCGLAGVSTLGNQDSGGGLQLTVLFFWQAWQMIGKRYLPELRVGIMAGVAYCRTGSVYQRYSLFCLMQSFCPDFL